MRPNEQLMTAIGQFENANGLKKVGQIATGSNLRRQWWQSLAQRLTPFTTLSDSGQSDHIVNGLHSLLAISKSAGKPRNFSVC